MLGALTQRSSPACGALREGRAVQPTVESGRSGRLGLAVFVILMAILAQPRPAVAQVDLFAPDTISGMLDIRVAAADGERSWLDGGFGKTRFSGGANGGWAAHLTVGEADLIWRPRLTWDLSAVIVGEVQPDHDNGPRLGEAYLVYKPTPTGATRFSARAGLYYPPISMEHEGPAWTVANTITPSAINSWVGEEVKVVGAEASVRHDFGEQEIGVTAGLFGFNDTSGTLLTMRGWTLDDVRANATGHYKLPPLSDFMQMAQSSTDNPVLELDHRIGVYGRIDWRVSDRLAINVFYYDNAGDLVSVRDLQWAWNTRFWNVGLSLDLDDRTRLLAQGMIGRTRFAFDPTDLLADTEFRAAYVLITRRLGDDAVTGRFDLFSTLNHADEEYGDTDEHGWAVTADYRKKITKHISALFEALHVESNRPARFDILGEAAFQRQTVLQAALRLSF